MFHGNLGQSYLNHESVTHIIATGWPIDLELIVISQVIAFTVAIPLALITSRRPNRPFDNVATTGTFGLLALPPFVIAPIMVAVFAVGLHWFPATGYVPISPGPSHQPSRHDPPLAGHHRRFDRRLLPATSLRPHQHPARGLHHHGPVQGPLVPTDHVPPRLPTLVASPCWPRPASTSARLIAGTFIVEYLFALDGIGYSLVVAVNQRDYLVVQGITLVVAIAYVVLQFIVDFIFTMVDPRVTRE